ncbi:MAG: outer membrane lipoprotein chaperone LolA [Gammaproteobacteria bacterium]|nr:outer membrane lipoprotein chaperone LolA [Gammaproteobacteria bacterium]
MIRFITLFMILIFSQSSIKADDNTDPMEQLQGYLQHLDSYEANFQQHIVSSSRQLIDSTSGRLLIKRPNRFRWEVISPYEQTIIADGNNIWSIDVDLEQVTVTDMESNLVNSPIMLLSSKDAKPGDYFSVEQIKSDTEMQMFLLQPLDSSANFEQVRLGFEDAILQLIELYDSLGQITIIRMTNIRNNPVMGNEAFIYQEIADFDVIDSRVQDSSLKDPGIQETEGE